MQTCEHQVLPASGSFWWTSLRVGRGFVDGLSGLWVNAKKKGVNFIYQ